MGSIRPLGCPVTDRILDVPMCWERGIFRELAT
jgi:hypothetical protein